MSRIQLQAAALAVLSAAVLSGCASSRDKVPGADLGQQTLPQPTIGTARNDQGKLVRVRFHSPSLGGPDSYLVYLPPGYGTAVAQGRQFPVLYLLHGDGAGAKHTALHMFNAAQVGAQVNQLVRERRIQPFLTVIPEGDDGTSDNDTEWTDNSSGKFASSVVDAVRAVDARWPTIANRDGRAIAGLSMGGYGAVNVGLQHLDVFSVLESWSGYFTARRKGILGNSPRQVLRANSPFAYVATMQDALNTSPIHVLLYQEFGSKAFNQQAPFASRLRGLGVPVLALVFHGPHNYGLWHDHLPLGLEFASRWLQSLG
jgi:enterochelin esterase-like enzyme